MHEDSRRQLGERFSAALEAPSDERLDAYFASDAGVFLQGSAILFSPPTLRDYLRHLKEQGQLFHRVSNVYVTPTGFGWLLVIRRTSDVSAEDTTGSPLAGLWLEATIENGRITRVWIHLTVEALTAIRQPVETYRASVATRQLPLPVDWEKGTPALLAAAERVDRQVDNSTISTGTAFSLGACLAAMLLAIVFVPRRRWIRPRNPVSTGQRQGGRMLLELRRALDV